MQILKNRIYAKQLRRSKNQQVDLLNGNSIKTLPVSDIELLCSYDLFVKQNFSAYPRIRIFKEVFTSLLYSGEKKRNNYTISFEKDSDISYGEVKFFVVKNSFLSLNDTFAVVRVFHVEPSRFFCHRESQLTVTHIVPVVDSDEITLISVKNIVSKVCRVGMYVCELPNKYERNL